MNKKEFESYLRQVLAELPIEKQEEILLKMKNKWIPDFINKRFKNYSYRSKCRRYFLKSKYIKVEKKNIKTLKTFIDGGYGDDDKWEDMEFLCTYMVCPVCGNQEEVDSKYIRTVSRR